MSASDAAAQSLSELRTARGLIALQQLPRVGPQTALRAALAGADALPGRVGEGWSEGLEAAGEELERYADAGVRVIAFFDEAYPIRLRAIHNPPPLLFVRGSLEALDAPRSVAVIGTREPTSFGVTATAAFTRALAGAGWTVVSGLAKGVDTLAHRGALEHGGPTVAVLGGGLDRVYPAENRQLAEAIVDRGGALVAEQPFGTRPHAGNLVARNRLQTGLSAAVVVIQTGIQGGSMHTVRHAASQGRPVFAPLPHAPHERSRGLQVLLTSPARELWQSLPAWREAGALCARLGDRPLAHPVSKERMSGFLDAVERALQEPQTTPEPRWWAVPEPVGAVAEAGPSLFGAADEPD